MFWQFDTGFVSQIDTILDKEDITLKELMDEEDILQECKAHNQKLIDFLTRPPIIEEMVNMIITEPPHDANEKVRFKYANIACEILTCDVSAVNDALTCNDAMLNKLFKYVDTDKQLNPLLSSFYTKTMSLLFAKRTDIIFEFLNTKNYVSLLLNHIETSAIMDLILKLITNVDNIDLRLSVVKWFHDNNLIGRLIEIFKSDSDPQRHINAAQLLCDMIKISREHQSLLQDKAEPDLLLCTLESTNSVNDLLTHMFMCRTESSLVSGISVLQSLLEYKRHSLSVNIQQLMPSQSNIQNVTEFEGMPQVLGMHQMMMGVRSEGPGPDQMTSLDAERLGKGVKQVQSAIIPKLNEFHSLLLNPPQKAPIKTTVGVIEVPLGATRLEVAHLITALLSSNNADVIEKLAELKTLTVLIDLFFGYPWNNFLHSQVEQTIVCVLNHSKINTSNSTPDSSESSISKSSILINELLTQCHIIERILESCETNGETDASKKHRPGYVGHLINIANAIVEKCDENLMKEVLSGELFEKWNTFVNETLNEINKKMCTPLVNEMPNAANIDDDVYRQQDNALQQAFIEYQMQQMTRNLCTQIGFAAHEFTEISDNIPHQVDQLTKVNFNFENQWREKDKSIEFDKICAERAKDSLENNSSDEEDLWEDRDIAESSIAQQKKPLSLFGIMDNSSDNFGGESFDLNASDGIRMDVDNPDPWSSENDTTASTVPVPMDTSNPWDMDKSQKPGNSIEADSWADFSSFSSPDFTSTEATISAHNPCVTTSSSSVTMSSSESHVVSSVNSDMPESTTSDEILSQIETPSFTEETSSSSLVTCEPQKLTSDEQENIVSSSTADNIQNGPS